MSITLNKELSVEQVRKYHEEGYLGPFTLCSPDEMAKIREKLVNEIDVEKNPHSQHTNHKLVYDLCTHENVIKPIQSIFGESLVLWRSVFWCKNPGEKAVPWHQDAYYWPIEPAINITAWLAIDPAFASNSCVQVIPGSHKSVVPHISSNKSDNMSIFHAKEADLNYVNTDEAIPMELEPGQFFLFNERLLHYSAPNTSDQRRIGLAIRITLPFVKIGGEQDSEQRFEKSGIFNPSKIQEGNNFLIGEDTVGINKYGVPPTK
ncbi:phytanoyl-CoA dioxygenase family protein [Sporosarcina soli]|uniref:Phytanoyl-CoA dioxygenase family protein n=1 Tax=Sporosarcina soli TaxID=334736 RepID=A0ABW0TNA7_9BACL